MPANTSPIFILTPKTGIGNCTVAATPATVYTAGSNGSLITAVRIMCQVASAAAARVDLLINDGSTNWIWQSIVTPIAAKATAVKAADYDFPMPGAMAYAAGTVVNPSVNLVQGSNGLYLPSGYSLRVVCSVSDSWAAFATGGDY